MTCYESNSDTSDTAQCLYRAGVSMLAAAAALLAANTWHLADRACFVENLGSSELLSKTNFAFFCLCGRADDMLSPQMSFRDLSVIKAVKARREPVRTASTNKEHLKETLEALKTPRYQGSVTKPWLDEDGNIIWSTTRCQGFTVKRGRERERQRKRKRERENERIKKKERERERLVDTCSLRALLQVE